MAAADLGASAEAGQKWEPISLSATALQQLQTRGNVQVPTYNRNPQSIDKWLLHVGLGGFSRAHLAMFTDELLRKETTTARPTRWGICGLGLMPWDVKLRDALKSQDYLYTLLNRDSSTGDCARIVGSILDYVFLPDDPQAALDRLADPSTAIVSLTVTEKGYCLDSSGSLDMSNDNVQHDLAPGGLSSPRTVLGLLTAGLKLRRERGVEPFTVLSCDNLPMNGSMARRMTASLASKIDPALGDWITSSAVSFPNSMVDRITPVTTQAEKDLLRDSFGLVDAWPVVSEPFAQWVVEDFNGRPAWETCAGVQFVEDVQPYELMKLRLLNSSHSALAYIGYMAGHRQVHHAVGNPLIRGFLLRYMRAIATTLAPVPGVDVNQYQATLISRFSNESIADQLLRLAQDGSVKWRSFLALGGPDHSALGALQRSGVDGEPPVDLALALAAWVRFLTGLDEAGDAIPVDDPMAEVLQPLARAAVESPDGTMTALTEFLSHTLGDSASGWPQLVSAVAAWLGRLCREGATGALQAAEASSLPDH